MTSLPPSTAHSAFVASCGGDHGGAHRRDAHDLERHRHRVGGELAAAGAGAGAGDVLDLGELLVAHLAARVRADGLEDVHGS